MRSIFLGALVAGSWLLSPQPDARAQEALARVSTDTVAVGDRFHLSIVLEHQAAVRTLLPDPSRGDTVLGDVELLSIERHTMQSGAGAGIRDSIVYTATTFALDSALVPPIPVGFVSETDTVFAETERVVLVVRSLVPADADDVQDITPIVPFARNWWPWIIGAALLLALVTAYVLLRRRGDRRPSAPLPPPEQPYAEALRRLDALAACALDSSGEVKYFYVEMSDALRTYIERRLGYPALESTTRELMANLDHAAEEEFPAATAGRIRTILHHADLVKFADARPPESAARRALAETRHAVEEIERHTRDVETSAAAGIEEGV